MSNDDLPEIPDPLYNMTPVKKVDPLAPKKTEAEQPSSDGYDGPDYGEDPAVALPDSTVNYTPKPVVDERLKDKFSSAVPMAFIGAGQGGGRLADSFYNMGYRRVCAVNTTAQDLRGLKMDEFRKKVIGTGKGGAGKDPEKGRLAAQESYEDIMDHMMRSWGEGVKQIYVCVGGGGGSGTGSWPTILDAAKEYMESTDVEKDVAKKLGVIMTLPKRSEGSRVQRNALDAVNLAMEKLENGEISSLILVDNSRIHELYPGLPVKMFWKVANDTFAGIFHTFNLLAAKDSDYNVFDKEDYKSVIQNGLMIFGRTKVDRWQGKEDISQAVRQNLQGSLLAEGFDLSTADMAGAIVVAHDDILEQIPMENIDYAFSSLGRALGNEGITLHNGIYEGRSPGMHVFTIVSGLDAPKARLEELENKAK